MHDPTHSGGPTATLTDCAAQECRRARQPRGSHHNHPQEPLQSEEGGTGGKRMGGGYGRCPRGRGRRGRDGVSHTPFGFDGWDSDLPCSQLRIYDLFNAPALSSAELHMEFDSPYAHRMQLEPIVPMVVVMATVALAPVLLRMATGAN
jgi:hypothetical protein